MDLVVSKRYLLIPISYEAQEKRLLLFKNGNLVYDMVARLDEFQPDTVQYLDIKQFSGETLTVRTEPDMDFSLIQADHLDDTGLYHEKYRPVAHFTASRGWINDPNGLTLVNGRYHLFFQYNPIGRDWGNMHWGHAVSTDLFHWKQQDIALFPDNKGTMFSGSGIIDTGNRAGLKTTDKNVLMLFFTAAGGTSKLSEGRPFTQCMAYSRDDGATFDKYADNPLIDKITEGNRDPKIIYNKNMNCYYLALYLKDDRYALFVSDDLLHWKQKQELSLPGDSECPDFYPLLSTDNHKEYWILSGASDRYLVGEISPDGNFQPIQAAKRLHYGTNSYAAQTFSGVTDGRTLRIAWNTSKIPNSPFNCAMCTPTEMNLKTYENEFLLCSMPAREIETLYQRQQKVGKTQLRIGDSLTCPLYGKAQDIKLRVSSKNNAPFHLSFLGMDVCINPLENSLKCKESIMPLFMDGNDIILRIITDTQAVEIFADQGEAFLCTGHIADYNLNRIMLQADENDLTIYEMQVFELADVWD